MAAGAARVALVNTTTAIVTNPASCPTGVASVVDLVSYGSTSCAGTLTTAALTNTTCGFAQRQRMRLDGGLADRLHDRGARAAQQHDGEPTRAAAAPRARSITSTLGGPTSVVLGSSIQLTATGFDASNNQLSPQPTITWSSDTPTNVDINPTTGNASGVAIGTANVTATSGSVSADRADHRHRTDERSSSSVSSTAAAAIRVRRSRTTSSNCSIAAARPFRSTAGACSTCRRTRPARGR